MLADRHRGLVERHTAADRHEIALAGLARLLRRVEQGGIPVVDHDLASVDPTRGVAPRRERLGLLEELDLEARLDRIGGVVEDGDVDALRSDPPDARRAPGPGSQIFPTPGHSPFVAGPLEERTDAVAADWKPTDVPATAMNATSSGAPFRTKRATVWLDVRRVRRMGPTVAYRPSCMPSTVSVLRRRQVPRLMDRAEPVRRNHYPRETTKCGRPGRASEDMTSGPSDRAVRPDAIIRPPSGRVSTL